MKQTIWARTTTTLTLTALLVTLSFVSASAREEVLTHQSEVAIQVASAAHLGAQSKNVLYNLTRQALGGRNTNAFSRTLAQETPFMAAQQEEEDEDEDEDEDNSAEGKQSRTKTLGARNISAYTRMVGKTVIGGYFDTEYNFPQDAHSFFDQHHLILQVSSMPTDRLLFNAEVEFEHGAVLGGDSNDGEIHIEQAWVDYKIQDWLVLRSGVILVPVGRLNILHDSDFRDTTTRPLFSGAIVPTTWMEPGAGFYGTLYPDGDWELNYEAYVMQGLTGKIADGEGLHEARPSLSADNNGGKSVTARVGVSPFIGLDLGLGGYFSHYDKDSTRRLGMLVGDLSYRLGPFELLGEGGMVFFDPIAQTDSAGKAQPDLLGPMWGYYLEAHYHLFPDFLKLSFLGENFEHPVVTLFTRLDQVDTNGIHSYANDRTRLTLGFNYRPIPTTAFKFEYQWNIENEAFLTGDFSKEKANNQFIASVAMGF